MKLKLYFFISLNVILGLLGALLIFLGLIRGDEIGRPLMESIGIGFIAAGIINIFDRVLTLEPPHEQAPRIEVVAEKRIATPQHIYDLKYNTSKVDIIGISLNHVFEELVNDPGQKMIDRLLRHNLQMRLFFIHPDSKYLEQRAREDNWGHADLVERQKRAVKLCGVFYEQLRAAYDAAKEAGVLNTHQTGSLQIKLLDFCPYITIYRVGEEEIYWGLYTSQSTGLNLPLNRTTNMQDPALYKHLHQHIHGLIDRDMKYPDLVSMPEMGEPELNSDLLESILKS